MRPHRVDPISGAWIFDPTPEERLEAKVTELQAEVNQLRNTIDGLSTTVRDLISLLAAREFR